MKTKNILISFSFCVLITQTVLGASLTSAGDLASDVNAVKGRLGGTSIMTMTNTLYTNLGGAGDTVEDRLTFIRGLITDTPGGDLEDRVNAVHDKIKSTHTVGLSLEDEIDGAFAAMNIKLIEKGVTAAADFSEAATKIGLISVGTGISREAAVGGLGLDPADYTAAATDLGNYQAAVDYIEGRLGGTAGTSIDARITALETLIGGTGLSLHARITALLAEVSGSGATG